MVMNFILYAIYFATFHSVGDKNLDPPSIKQTTGIYTGKGGISNYLRIENGTAYYKTQNMGIVVLHTNKREIFNLCMIHHM